MEGEGALNRGGSPTPPEGVRVSVAMITYNHERFVARAIESVLMQRTEFRFELLIGEDASPDGTRAIVERYARAHPDRIRVITSERNVGMNRNLARTIEACRGDYIALLDGDDYWTSPDKLRLQVEFLDRRPSFAICFHNVRVVKEPCGAGGRPFNRPDQKPVSSLEDLFLSNFMATSSVMFRRGLFGTLPEWFFDLEFGDWPLHVLNAQHGAIGYLQPMMSAYRLHSGGAWSGRPATRMLQARLKLFEHLRGHLGKAHSTALCLSASDCSYRIARTHEHEGDLALARRWIRKALVERLRGRRIKLRHLRMMLRVHSPFLVRRARVRRSR
jgi:glycosyltransferase involved in cell wall biosynthesis